MKLAYELTGGKGSYIRVYLLNKKERIDKQKADGIRLELKSVKNVVFSLDVKDWEAQSIITGLSESLIRKRLQRRGYR